MKTSIQNQLVVTDIPTPSWLFLLCCFVEQKARKVKGEAVTPPFVVLSVVPWLASCSTLRLSAPSPSALFLLPLLPSKMWVFGLLLWLFFFVSHLDSADWLLITPPYLIQSSSLHSWSTTDKPTPSSSEEEQPFSLLNLQTVFSAAPWCRSSVALLFSGTDGATDSRKILEFIQWQLETWFIST